ncbi:MAG: hypothetical protein AB7V02_13035, partial [Parvularculaceae bacterium]
RPKSQPIQLATGIGRSPAGQRDTFGEPAFGRTGSGRSSRPVENLLKGAVFWAPTPFAKLIGAV